MNGYLTPSVFWAMISFACLLFLMCLFAGPFWSPWVLGIAILATVVEWGTEQRWHDHLKLSWLWWELGWIDGDLEKLDEQMRGSSDAAELAILRLYYAQRVKEQYRLRMAIADLDYRLEHRELT